MGKGDVSMDLHRYFKEIEQKDGIWYDMQTQYIGSSFSDEMQNGLYSLEDTSWWFQYRADVIGQVAELYFRKGQPVFDVGGGNGYTTCRMQQGGGYDMVLLEPSSGACKNARKRGVSNVICGTLEKENVRDGSIEQILLLDVLEHIEDDTGFLNLIRQKLARHGKLLVTVPAFQALWSSEDEEAGHYRRYTLKQFTEAAEEAGFRVCYANYFFGFLVLPILFVRVGLEKIGLLKRNEDRTVIEKKEIQKKQFRDRGGIVGIILRVLEKTELHRLARNQKIYLGSSILCVLERV